MNNDMQKVNNLISFVQKTQKYFIIFLFFPFISSGEHELSMELREQETAVTLERTSELLRKTSEKQLKTSKQSISWLFYRGIPYYQLNRNQPIWTSGFVPNENAKTLVELLASAHNVGLLPEKLHVDEIYFLEKKLLSETDVDELFRLRTEYELAMTGAGIKYISQLNLGLIATDSLFYQHNDVGDPFVHHRYFLFESLKSENFPEAILKAQPQNMHYHRLQHALQNWLLTVELTRDSVTIDDNDLTSTVCKALTLHGFDINVMEADSLRLSQALKPFQLANSLPASGVLTDETRHALQRSPYDKFLQVVLNLERMKLNRLPSSDKLVFVNIPSYKVRVIRNGETAKIFKAIVGKPVTPTPEITSKIDKIVTCPKWYVPKSIATREIFYHMKKDSSYLEKRNFTLLDNAFNEVAYHELDWNSIKPWNFEYKIMQQPGSSNALGTVKFLFPNPYSVYLHDTPAKRYFEKEERAYSHGCVRVDEPQLFGDYLLTQLAGEQNYASLSAYIRKGQTKEISLEQPVDIAIRYITCEAGESNDLIFLNDIYQRDKPIIERILN